MAEILFRELSFAIIGAAMEVHGILGPGFLEAVYQTALAHELTLRGIPFEQYKKLPVAYKGIFIGEYEAQAHHYLTATGCRLAILINFGTPSLTQKRVAR